MLSGSTEKVLSLAKLIRFSKFFLGWILLSTTILIFKFISLVRALRTERKLIQSLQDIGFTAKESIQIISSPVLTKASRSSDKTIDGVYDVRDTLEEPFVIWWNDLEKDSRYKEWSTNVQEVTIYIKI